MSDQETNILWLMAVIERITSHMMVQTSTEHIENILSQHSFVISYLIN